MTIRSLVLMVLIGAACSATPTTTTFDPSAFCSHLDATRSDLLFEIDMTPEEILGTTRRAQEVYAEALDLAPPELRPAVEAGLRSWQNLETRFGEAFAAGLSEEEAFNAILVEWEELVDVPANERVVEYVIDVCEGTPTADR